jgi:hypothetical protein
MTGISENADSLNCSDCALLVLGINVRPHHLFPNRTDSVHLFFQI